MTTTTTALELEDAFIAGWLRLLPLVRHETFRIVGGLSQHAFAADVADLPPEAIAWRCSRHFDRRRARIADALTMRRLFRDALAKNPALARAVAESVIDEAERNRSV